jgi:hypothetical protein
MMREQAARQEASVNSTMIGRAAFPALNETAKRWQGATMGRKVVRVRGAAGR